MSELKPCPFCGGEAFVSIVGVSCSKCPAAMIVDANATEQDAIDAWNTRAERACTNTKMDGSYFRCSRCHATFDMLDDEGEPVIWWNDSPQFNSYCPCCGAKVVYQ